jgi:phosphatidylglycerophosphatase A
MLSLPRFIIRILSTFFYVGLIPFAPGTFASIAGVFLFCLVRASPSGFAAVFFSVAVAGFMVSGKAEEVFRKKDAACIVIDEVAGMLLCFLFLPYSPWVVIAAFVLFRVFDIWKPYPIRLIQNMRGSMGVMGDDILAAVLTNLILQIAVRAALFKIS